MELLPFDEIKERIKDRIEYGLAYRVDSNFYFDIAVTKISLIYMKSAKANALNEYYYAPMWCFLTDTIDEAMPLLPGMHLINALDGTFVTFAYDVFD